MAEAQPARDHEKKGLPRPGESSRIGPGEEHAQSRRKINPASALDRFTHELLAQMTHMLRRLEWDERRQLTKDGQASLKLVKECMTYGREYVALSLGAKAASNLPDPDAAKRPEGAGDSASALAALRDAAKRNSA